MLQRLFLCCLCIQMTPWCLRVWVFGLRLGLFQLILVCKYWYELYNSYHKLSCHERSQKPSRLAEFQLFPCQKLHFWIVCSTCGGFNLVILPKTAEKKILPLLHCLGRSHKGIPARAKVTHTHSRLRKCLLSGYPAACRPELCGCRGLPARVSVIYPGTRLPGYRRAHADMSVKLAAFVFLICIR